MEWVTDTIDVNSLGGWGEDVIQKLDRIEANVDDPLLDVLVVDKYCFSSPQKPVDIEGDHVVRCPTIICERLANAVGGNTHLKKISFPISYEMGDEFTGIDAENLETVCRGLVHNRSIEMVHLNPHLFAEVDERVLQLLLSFFESNRNITTLVINQECDMDSLVWQPGTRQWSDGMRVLRKIFNTCTSLKHVYYYASADEDANDILKGFCSMLDGLLLLEELNLEPVPFVSGDDIDNIQEYVDFRWHPERMLRIDGYSPLGNLLTSPYSKLTRLHINVEIIDVDAIVALFKDLRYNCILRCLKLTYNEVVDENLVECLRFYNHTLESVQFTRPNYYDETEEISLSDEVSYLLKMNRQQDKRGIRIRKSLDYDFLVAERTFYERPFEADEFDVRLLPYVLWSIGNLRGDDDPRSERARFFALHYFIRNQPVWILRKAV